MLNDVCFFVMGFALGASAVIYAVRWANGRNLCRSTCSTCRADLPYTAREELPDGGFGPPQCFECLNKILAKKGSQ